MFRFLRSGIRPPPGFDAELQRLLREEPVEVDDFWARRVDARHLRRLGRYVLRRRRQFLRAVAMNIILTFLMLAAPQIIKLSIDGPIAHHDFRGLSILGGIFTAIALCMWGVMRVGVTASVTLGQLVLDDIRQELFTHIQALSSSFFDRTKAGKIISRVDGDLMSMEELLAWGASDILSSSLILAGALAMMASYNVLLATTVAALLPTMLLGTLWFRRKGTDAYRRMRESYSRLTGNLAENIAGVRVVQAFARETDNLERFNILLRHHAQNAVKAGRIWGVYWPFLSLHAGIGTVVILTYGAHLIREGELKLGELIAFQLYLTMFFGPINLMGEVYNSALSASASAERIFALLDTKPEVHDVADAVELPALRGEVEFRDVHFRYGPPELTPEEREGGVKWILEDVSFAVPPGSMCALVGHTGSGKSTMANLIARFYECQRGAVLLDGIDAKRAELSSLRRQVGIVPQSVFLFNGTVMDNIRYARQGATDEEVIESARALGSLGVIERLSDGFQTVVKERGQGLSLGERQIISFTRAMLANPRILILDEATSAVDTTTQDVVSRAFERLLAGRTAFVVAHRLSTIRRASLVLVIDRGRIIERGTHEQLLALGGEYAKLYREFLGAGAA